MGLAVCMICHEDIEYQNIGEVNFLWNDELYRGFPICTGCIDTLDGKTYLRNINYKFVKKVRKKKKRGLDKWM